MTLSRQNLALSFLLLAPLAPAATNLEDYLPADAALVIRLNDPMSLQEKMEGHPLEAFAKSEALKAFFAPALKLLESEDAKDSADEFEEAMELIDGPILLGVDFSQMLTPGTEPGASEEPGALILVEVTDAAKMKDLLEADAEDDEADGRWEEKSFMGEAVRTHYTVQVEGSEVEDGSYALVDRILLVSSQLSVLQDSIASIKGQGGRSFSDGAAAARFRSEYAESDLACYLNFGPIVQAVEQGVRESMRQRGEEPNMFMPTPDAVLGALDLGSLKNMMFGARIEDELVRTNMELELDFDRGIGRILDSFGTEYPTPSFVPADAVSVGSSSFDIGKALAALESIVAQASPFMGAMIQGQLSQIQQATGIDMRADLLGSIGGGFVLYSVELPEPIEGLPLQPFASVWGFHLDDPLAFDRALQALINATPLASRVETRDYMGTSLRIIPDPVSGRPASVMAVHDSWFLVSDQLFAIQNALATSGSGSGFWDSAQLKEGADLLPANGVELSYLEVKPFLKLALQAMAQVLAQFQPETEDMPLTVDATAIQKLDDEELPFHMLGRTYQSADGIRSEAVIYTNER